MVSNVIKTSIKLSDKINRNELKYVNILQVVNEIEKIFLIVHTFMRLLSQLVTDVMAKVHCYA